MLQGLGDDKLMMFSLQSPSQRLDQVENLSMMDFVSKSQPAEGPKVQLSARQLRFAFLGGPF